MTLKFLIVVGVIAGSTIGSFIPAIWGDSIFSFSSIVLSFIGGLAGIWAGYKVHQAIE